MRVVNSTNSAPSRGQPNPVRHDRGAPDGGAGDLDDTDRHIVRELARDARIANNALAERVGIAPSTCLGRVRSLRQRGVIRGYHADVDPAALGMPLQAMIAVRLQSHARSRIRAFVADVAGLPEVLNVFFLAGKDDFLLHVAAASTATLREFVETLSSNPDVSYTETSLIFEHIRADAVGLFLWPRVLASGGVVLDDEARPVGLAGLPRVCSDLHTDISTYRRISERQAAMPSQGSYRDALLRVIDEVVAPGAAAVDAVGEFPRAQLDALGAAGLLGLTVPSDYGGGGAGLREAADVIRELGSVCGSTAMVVSMHYAAVAALTAAGGKDTLSAVAAGKHLSTLAFSEKGSRSHFWVPLSSAAPLDDGQSVRLDAVKSWVTSAGHADSCVWSSRPVSAEAAGPMTLWLVPGDSDGLSVTGTFDGLGLRGNSSAPMTAAGVTVPLSAMLGSDGAGLDLAMTAVLPVFLVCSAAMSAGLLRRLASETAGHLQRTRLEHLGVSLAQQAVPRAQLARLRIEADRTWALISETLNAVESGREDALLLVLEAKAAAGEAAADAADLALKVGGGAAFRKESVVERFFRDSRAARVMAPTTDALQDFIGRAVLGLPLLGEV